MRKILICLVTFLFTFTHTALCAEIQTWSISYKNSENIDGIQAYFRIMERAEFEVVGVGLYENRGETLNIVDFIERNEKITRPLIYAFIIKNDTQLKQLSKSHEMIKYALMQISGRRQYVFVGRPFAIN